MRQILRRSFDGILHPKIRLVRNQWFCTQLNKHNVRLEAGSSFLEKFLDSSTFDDCRCLERKLVNRCQRSMSTALDKRLCVTYHTMLLTENAADPTALHVSTAIVSTPFNSPSPVYSMNIPTYDDRPLHGYDPVTSAWKEIPSSPDDIHLKPNVHVTKKVVVTVLSSTYPSLPDVEAGYRYSPLTDFERCMILKADQTTVLINKSLPVKSNATGKPTEEHLQTVFKSLSHSLPRFFVQPHDYSVYNTHLIFENNIRGVTTKGLASYVQQLALVRIIGHLKFAHVRMEVLKITKHTEDGTIRVRWRIRGISGVKMIFNLWKMRPWNWKEMYSEESDWYDGFSTFYVGGDGKVHRHVCDKMMPDDDKETFSLKGLAAKLALLLGVVQRPLLDDLNMVLTSLLKLDKIYPRLPR